MPQSVLFRNVVHKSQQELTTRDVYIVFVHFMLTFSVVSILTLNDLKQIFKVTNFCCG